MSVTLQNASLRATVSERGAELRSLEANGVSYLWNGDPAHWGYCAPTLFPIVGALRDGKADSAGGSIQLPRHGFVRTAMFTQIALSADSVTYRLTDSAETRSMYPFAFSLSITHSLQDHTLTTCYTVENTGDGILPFVVGGHPAFRVPLTAEERFEDYAVTFEQRETADCPLLDGDGLVRTGVRRPLLAAQTTLPLSHDLFREDALLFESLRSRRVRLSSDKSGHGVELAFEGMPYFALWSPVKDAPFVCLEPWTGTATTDQEDDVFEHKRGMRLLPPGETYQAAYHVTVF